MRAHLPGKTSGPTCEDSLPPRSNPRVTSTRDRVRARGGGTGPFLALALFVALLSPLTTQAQTQLDTIADLRVSAGVGGRFAEPVCGEQALTPSSFARLADALTTSGPTSVDASAEMPAPLVIDSGGLLAPHGVTLFASEQHPDAHAEMIEALGYQALTFGENELGAPRAPLLAAIGALRERGIPTIASNLRCEGEDHPLCELIVDAGDGVPMLTRGGERIALLTFLTPAALGRVAPANTRGITLSPVGPSMALAVRAARARGATLVIAVVDDGWGAGAAARALELADALDEDDKPDLVLSTNAGSQLVFARPSGFRPAVAAAPPQGMAQISIRRDRADRHLDVLVRPTRTPGEGAPAAPPIASWMQTVGASYCAAFGDPLPGGTLTSALDANGLLELAGQIAMENTGAELALLNRGVVDQTFQHEPGQLRAADLDVGIQYDGPLVVAEVPATWLRTVARNLEDTPELMALGLTIQNAYGALEKVRVNGRLIELRGRYRVVTLGFLAAGGDGLLPDGPDWEPYEDLTLHSSTQRYLEAHAPASGEGSELDPRERVPDPADRVQWTFQVDVDAVYGGSAVRNPGGYEDTQLQRQNTSAFGMELELQANAISPRFAWNNDLDLRYRITRTPESGGFDEGDDRISYRTSWLYRRFRVESGDWYMPQLIFEGYVESEFTASRDFHHLLLRPTAGLQFTFNLWLSLKIHGGFEVEALEDNAGLQPGVGFHVILKPWVLMQSGLRKVILGYEVDWFVSDLGQRNRRALRANLDLSFALTTRFALAMVVDMYGVREGRGDYSFASNVTASFRVGWLGRITR